MIKTTKKLRLIGSLAISVGFGFLCSAQTFPLSSNDWSNPEFQERFKGSYNVDTEVNPSITSEEKVIFDQIIPLLNENKTSEAIEQLKAYITPTTNAAFDFIFANLYYQENQMAEAAKYYQAAIKKFPNYYRAYLNLGRAYINDGKYSDALPLLQKALAIKPGDGSLYGLLGYCYMNDRYYASALDAYRLAIMLDPKNNDWKMGKLNCLISLEEHNEAIGLLYEMISANPDNAEFWQLQANEFLDTNQVELAAANLEIIDEMGAATSSSLVLLGDIYINKEMPEQALRIYSKAIDGGIKVNRALRIATSLSNLGNYEATQTFLEKIKSELATEFTPEEELETLNLEAQIALNTGNEDEAATILEKVVEKDPMNGRALLLLTDYYTRKADYPKASFYAENAAKVPAVEHSALIKGAQIMVKTRDYREAATLLRRAQNLKFQDYVADYLVKIESAAQRAL